VSKAHPKPAAEARVSNVELFFDLVFVFTVTQLTRLVDQSQAPMDLLGAFLILVLVWWMYAGYAWLINATGAGGGMRLVLLAAMAGFLVMALSLPSFFNQGGPWFGLAYLVVVLLHAGSFAARAGRAGRGAILGILAINASAAGLAIAAGLAPQAWRWAYLLGGASMFIVSTLLQGEREFSVNPGHFAERHGLVVLIALGESVFGIGTGAAGQAFGPQSLVSVILSLALVAGLWWAYFGGDDARAEHQLVAARPAERPRMALLGYWYAHLAMITGIVLVATGLKRALGHAGMEAQATAWLLGGGVALYLAGGALFRWIMGIRPVGPRLTAAALALAWALLWPGSAPWLGLGGAICLLMALFLLEDRFSVISA
jgi:low temperature requirement protein LtrA